MYKETEEKIIIPESEREAEYMTKDDDKIEKALNAAIGNLKHSGMIVTGREKELVRKKLSGKISEEEFIKIICEEAMK